MKKINIQANDGAISKCTKGNKIVVTHYLPFPQLCFKYTVAINPSVFVAVFPA